MEPQELAQQSLLVCSRLEGLFPDGYENQSGTLTVLTCAFYTLTDKLLNITQGPNGRAVVDISHQGNRFEWAKSQTGLAILSTMDWLRQVARNLAEANKPALFVQSAIGLPSAMGVVNLLTTDFYENPLHALVVDMPDQQGSFPCDAAQVAAQNLCTAGVEGGVIVECSIDSPNPGRVQINLMNPEGGLMVSSLTDAGALESTLATTCSTLGVDVGLVAPTTPAVPPTEGSAGQAIPDYAATPGVPDVKCVENPLIGTYDVAAVKAGFKAACGVDINDAMAQEFLNYTQTQGRTDLYGLATAEQLAAWAEQQWPRFMGGASIELTTDPTVTTAPVEIDPITPSEVCNLTDPGLEDRIVLNTGSPEELQADLLTKCGLELTPEQFDFIARALGLDIWVNDTSAEVRLQFIKEMAGALGVPALGTPLAFEGVPPTPALATPVVGGEQTVSEEDDNGFWDLNFMTKWEEIVPGIERAFRGFNLLALISILAVPIVGYMRWRKKSSLKIK